MFFKYFAHELRFSSSAVASTFRLLLGEFWSFSIWEDLDLASSPPNLDVNGVKTSSVSSSSSSFPSPMVAELLLLANRALRSLRAAYLDLPLGYWSSPEIFLEADTDSSGVSSLWESPDPSPTAVDLDFARYLLTKLSLSSLRLYLLENPVVLSELSSLLYLLSLDTVGSGDAYLLYRLEVLGLNGVLCSESCPQDPL